MLIKAIDKINTVLISAKSTYKYVCLSCYRIYMPDFLARCPRCGNSGYVFYNPDLHDMDEDDEMGEDDVFMFKPLPGDPGNKPPNAKGPGKTDYEYNRFYS